jgi:hypothetical protein
MKNSRRFNVINSMCLHWYWKDYELMNITADFVRLNSKFVYALSRVETKILTPTLNLNCLMVEEFACTFANYFYGGIDIISYRVSQLM